MWGLPLQSSGLTGTFLLRTSVSEASWVRGETGDTARERPSCTTMFACTAFAPWKGVIVSKKISQNVPQTVS